MFGSIHRIPHHTQNFDPNSGQCEGVNEFAQAHSARSRAGASECELPRDGLLLLLREAKVEEAQELAEERRGYLTCTTRTRRLQRMQPAGWFGMERGRNVWRVPLAAGSSPRAADSITSLLFVAAIDRSRASRLPPSAPIHG